MGEVLPRLGIVGDNGDSHQPRPLARREDWRLTVIADGRRLVYTIDDLAALNSQKVGIAIECVSAGFIAGRNVPQQFTGIPFRLLAAELGDVSPYQTVIFRSAARAICGPRHLPHETSLELDYCLTSPHTLVAWELNGAPLPYANGWPLRSTVGPDRYFYKSIKWLNEIEFSRLPMDQVRGSWETYAGYHNLGRTAQKEKFTPIMRLISAVAEDGGDVSTEIPRDTWQQTLDELVAARDLSRLILAKVEYMGLELPKDYRGVRFHDGPFIAKLRGCKFSRCNFAGTDMRGVNLSLSKMLRCDFAEDGANPAVLAEVDAEGADFSGADLTGVDMRDSYLAGASFYPQNQRKSETRPAAAKVKGLDLRGARNLDAEQAVWLAEDGARL